MNLKGTQQSTPSFEGRHILENKVGGTLQAIHLTEVCI